MIRPMSVDRSPAVAVWTHTGASLRARYPALTEFTLADRPAALSRHPRWLDVLQSAFGYKVFALTAVANGRVCGYLPLAFIDTLLFGRFLVGLPYLSSNGVVAAAPDVQSILVSRAAELADELNVKHLELRHETPIDHPKLTASLTTKVHMRLPLVGAPDLFWKQLDPKVRNQVRKGEKHHLRVDWGGAELLPRFYDVYCRNMRDLGTPPYGRALFRAIVDAFPADAEFAVVSADTRPVAAALLLHGSGVTEVPTASSLREFNATCANMLMYRHLIDRAIERGQCVFDFGRSTVDGPTYRFKKQWGAFPHAAHWQYYLRRGSVGEMRPDHPRYRRMIQLWQKLPVPLTRVIGPPIVRGIP